MMQQWWDSICQNVLATMLWTAVAFLAGWLAYRWGARRRADAAAKAEAIKEAVDAAKEERLRDTQRYEEGPLFDGAAHRPDELRPPALEPGRDLNEAERKVIAHAMEVLTSAPDLINEGKLDEAERQVAAQERAVAALHERLSKGAAAVTRATVAVLLARADIQLGTVAFERRQYGRAAEIYQRAVAWAQQGNDEETLRLALYQTGVSFGYGRNFRPAKEFFERVREHEDAPGRLETLHNLAWCLGELGDHPGALSLYDEVLRLYAELVQEDPGVFRPDVVKSLNNRGNALRAMGRREEALTTYEDALGLYRQLAEMNPDAYRGHIAGTLNNRGIALAELGRLEEALAAFAEAVALFRRAGEAEGHAATSRMVGALTNMSNVLGEMGRIREGLEACDEALKLHRRLSQPDPEAHRADLSLLLHNRGTLLTELGRREEALAAYDEALDIRRSLAQAEPEAYRQYVAMTLCNRGAVLRALARNEEALAAYDEALAIYAELMRKRPQVFGPLVRTVLDNRALIEGGAAAWQAFMRITQEQGAGERPERTDASGDQ